MIKLKNIFVLLLSFVALAMFVLSLFALHVHFFASLHYKIKKADAIVVFGASVLPNGEPSNALRDRTKKAAELLLEGYSGKVILSGTKSFYGFHEADVAEQVLLASGIDKNKIYKDYFGHSTCHTIQNLDKNKSYIFVSNAFHLAKINFFAKRFEIKEFYLSDSGYKEYRKNIYFIFREAVSILYNLIFFDGTCENGLKYWDIYFGNLFDRFLSI